MVSHIQAQYSETSRRFSLLLNACMPDTMPAKHVPLSPQIFSLIACPAVSYGTRYKFVRIINGERVTVAIGRAQSRYATLNLAAIRRRGARLGVQEIHVMK